MTIRRRRSVSIPRLSEHFTITMTPEMLERLALEAERRQVSMANLARDAVEQLLKSSVGATA